MDGEPSRDFRFYLKILHFLSDYGRMWYSMEKIKMQWLNKLLIPKHETKLRVFADNAQFLENNSNCNYKFLDKFGNGFQIFIYHEHNTPASLTFIVDKTIDEDSVSHDISYWLRCYLINLVDTQHNAAREKWEAEVKANTVKTLSEWKAGSSDLIGK